jgi:hypothetical protein
MHRRPGKTTYILPGLVTSESRTSGEVFGPASSVTVVHTVTQRVRGQDGLVSRVTTCSCDIYCFINSIRDSLTDDVLRLFCPHCVLVNLIEDHRESTESGKRELFQKVYPLLSK